MSPCARLPACPSWLLLSRAAGVGAAALFLWITLAPQTLSRISGDGRLHLTAMDVGQGDALLVTFPNGRTLMVDTGGVSIRGDFDIGDRVLGPALRARGVARLDYLSFTHGDPDHIGGAAVAGQRLRAARDLGWRVRRQPRTDNEAACHRGPPARGVAVVADEAIA